MTSPVDKLNKTRAENWCANFIKSRFRIVPEERDERIWLFSAWAGMRFSDNSRYLFEWMTRFHPEIKCIWQTCNQNLYEEMDAIGYQVQLIGSRDADEMQKLAGVCICTHGVDDFGPVPKIYGSTIVFLGHGPIAKKLWRSQLDLNRGNALTRALSDMKWKLFNYMKADIYIACSQFEMEALREALLIGVEVPFVITGLPRNDALATTYSKDEVFSERFLNEHPQLNDRRIAVYMPTFRRHKDQVIADGLAELSNNQKFLQIMERHNAVLVCKMHYLSDVSGVEENSSLVLSKDEDVLDTQKLMANADYLVTDYSSCAIDYALTGKPICYFYPDGQHESVETPMLPIFFNVSCVNRALSVDEFVDKLDEDLSGVGLGRAQSKALNAQFNTHSSKIGQFCSCTYEGIMRKMGGLNSA